MHLCNQSVRDYDPGVPIETVAFGPQGKRIATGGWSGTVVIWDAASGNAITHIDHGGLYGYGVAFSPFFRGVARAVTLRFRSQGFEVLPVLSESADELLGFVLPLLHGAYSKAYTCRLISLIFYRKHFICVINVVDSIKLSETLSKAGFSTAADPEEGRRLYELFCSELREHGINPIDLVAVNLYPFRETASSGDASFEQVPSSLLKLQIR